MSAGPVLPLAEVEGKAMNKATERAWHVWLAANEQVNKAANTVADLDAVGHVGTLRHDEALVEWIRARAEAERLYQVWIASTYSAQLAVVAAAGGVSAWWRARGDAESLLAWEGGELEEPSLLQEVPC